METITIIKLKKCGWCGSEFIPRHNRQTYCTENGTYCKDEARREQNRQSRLKYYYKYGNTKTIGTSNLTQHKQDNFLLEAQLIQKEKQRIGIS
ncbi:hypothetical protein SDC9_07431 [bioreactor metagenome]|uniref:Uncharacterized protein n=1 Tax=bioreactor metagenome TaxID=1076179 RepID=A0A644T6P7_9ZZZZ|nr:hypothetical protein [Methanobrevibacter sp.]MEA4956888.1 hypothetical protein [Methanobrevibacter sp.]